MYPVPVSKNPYSPLHYALVFGVGVALSSFSSVPIVAGALLYTLGFWVRGLPQTRAYLEAGGAATERKAAYLRQYTPAEAVRIRLAQDAASVDALSAAQGMPAPFITQPVGAGVSVNPGAGAPVVYVVNDGVVNGNGRRDVIDADQVF